MERKLPPYEIAANELVDYCFEAENSGQIEDLIRQFLAKEPYNKDVIQFAYDMLYADKYQLPDVKTGEFESAGEEQGMGIQALFQVVRTMGYFNPKSPNWIKNDAQRKGYFLQQLETLDSLDCEFIVLCKEKAKEIRIAFPKEVLEKVLTN